MDRGPLGLPWLADRADDASCLFREGSYASEREAPNPTTPYPRIPMKQTNVENEETLKPLVTDTEWQHRCGLAGLYRMCDLLGWTDLTATQSVGSPAGRARLLSNQQLWRAVQRYHRQVLSSFTTISGNRLKLKTPLGSRHRLLGETTAERRPLKEAVCDPVFPLGARLSRWPTWSTSVDNGRSIPSHLERPPGDRAGYACRTCRTGSPP